MKYTMNNINYFTKPKIMRKKIIHIIIIILFFVLSSLYGQTNNYENYGINQYWGMGQSGGSTDYFPNSFWINPALNNDFKYSVSTNIAILHDIRISEISSRFRYGKKHYFSFGINYENYGTFDGRDEYGNLTNTFNASQSQYLFGYAIHISNHLSLGTNIIYLMNSIADSNYSTVNYQYGMLLSTDDKINSLGIVKTSFPLENNSTWRIAFSHQLEHLPLRINIDYRLYDDKFDYKNISIGGLFCISKNFNLLTGMNFQRFNLQAQNLGAADIFAGLSIGATYLYNNINIGLSLYNYGALGRTTSLGISYSVKELN